MEKQQKAASDYSVYRYLAPPEKLWQGSEGDEIKFTFNSTLLFHENVTVPLISVENPGKPILLIITMSVRVEELGGRKLNKRMF